MGNIIETNNKIPKKEIIKATIDSSVGMSQSNAINESDYQSFPNPEENYPKIDSKNNILVIKEKKDLLNNKKNNKIEKINIFNNSSKINKIKKK